MSAHEFKMPACYRHFFKGCKWWCRACHREVEHQFRDVCEAYWAVQSGESPNVG